MKGGVIKKKYKKSNGFVENLNDWGTKKNCYNCFSWRSSCGMWKILDRKNLKNEKKQDERKKKKEMILI